MFTSSWSSCANSVCSVCRSSGEIIAILHFPLFLFMVCSTNMQGLPAISQPLVHCANPLYSVYLLPGLKSNATGLLFTGDTSFCTNYAMIHPRLQKLLQVYLQSLLFQVEFSLDLSQHLIIDAPLVAESNDGRPLGLEHLLAKTTPRRQAFTIPLV